MPKSKENLKRELYDYLSSKGHHPVSYNIDGETAVPEESEIIQFHFHMNGRDYGAVTVTIGGVNQMNVFFNSTLLKSLRGFETDTNPNGISLIEELKRFAITHGLTFSKKNMDELGRYLTDVRHTAKLDEGYYGTSRTSYNDKVPESVRMIIRHNTKIKEGDKRYRHIEKIFLENSQGERVIVPTTSPNYARPFAVHISEGGTYHDDRWKHLEEMLGDIRKLGGFIRAAKSCDNESVVSVCNEATEHYTGIRETMQRLRSPRGYRKYFETWSPSLMEKTDSNGLASMFGDAMVDQRISEAVPVLAKLGVTVREIKEANEFESWASDLVEEGLEPTSDGQAKELLKLIGNNSDEFPVGPDAFNAIGKLNDLIEDDELFDRLHKIAAVNPDTDARPTIISWMQEQDSPVYEKIMKEFGSAEQPPAEEPEPAKAPEAPEAAAEPSEEPEEPKATAKPAPKPTADNPLAELKKLSGIKQIKEVDNPDYQQSTTSAIPGTPDSLKPAPTEEDMIAYEKEMKSLKKFMGHR